MNDNYQVTWVDGINLSYMRNFNMNSTTLSLSRMKPLGKWGTVGVGVNYTYMFGKDNFGEETKCQRWVRVGYNFLYANMVKVNERIVYSPALIFAQNPISYTEKMDGFDAFGTTSKDVIGILSKFFHNTINKIIFVQCRMDDNL